MVPSFARDRGTYSTMGFWEITTPAACMDVWRGSPSRRLAISISRCTVSSVSYICRSSGFMVRALPMVMFSSFGTFFAMLSTNP